MTEQIWESRIPESELFILFRRPAHERLPAARLWRFYKDVERIAIYPVSWMKTDRSCVELFRFVGGTPLCGFNEFHEARESQCIRRGTARHVK